MYQWFGEWLGGRVVVYTYTNNGRVLGHGWRVVLLDARVFFNSKVLYITAAEDDIFINLVGRSNFFLGPAFAAFRAKGADIFE